MAPIKFEEQLKDKLEKRSLQPSSDAWNSLADRLDKEEQKQNNSRFWWLGIAATIVGVILVTTQFYKDNSETKDLPVIVETQSLPQNSPNSNETPSHVVTQDESFKTQSEVIAENHTTSETSLSTQNSVVSETQKSHKKESVAIQNKANVNAVAVLNDVKSKSNDIQQVKTLSQEELKIIEVVDLIKKLDSDESSVSDREIDSLLKQAQREILQQRILDESTKTVNADALLQDVEVELEQSFRDRVFEALRENFSSVKTAVAERNN